MRAVDVIALGDALDRLQDRLKAAPDKAQIILPDLATTYGVSLSDAVNAVYADGQKNIVEALWGLFGRIVGVRRDDPTDNGNTLLEYVETLSPDIAPLLVLDASARVRETYRLWSQHRGGLVSLPSAKKDYSPLTVHVWNAGGGKRTFWKNKTRSLQIKNHSMTRWVSLPMNLQIKTTLL